jgi:hypothetical protein
MIGPRRNLSLVSLLAAMAAAAMVAACSFNMPTAEDILPNTPKFEFKSIAPARQLRPLSAPVLVGPDGSCAASAAEPEFSGGGIALDMSECDVVQRAGRPDNIDISTDPGGTRAVVLTYTGGERPGIYRFASGRLKSIERGPEPPQPERPAKKTKTKSS